MPSTLMEYFASDPRVLHSIGRHYKTGEKLPLDTLERYSAARKIFAGVDLQMQTFYSIMDQVNKNGIIHNTNAFRNLSPYPPITSKFALSQFGWILLKVVFIL